MQDPLFPDSPVGSSWYQKSQSQQQQIKQTAQKNLSAAQRHYKAMYEIGNTKIGQDGRTYVKIDERGEYQSCFVSQYSKIIDKNLEPGVKKLCQALHQKGYLTFGSCQGHPNLKLRWVGLVFNTVEQKQQFIDAVDLLGLDIFWYDHHINTVERPSKKLPWYVDGIELHIVWNNTAFEDQSIDTTRELPYTDKELTQFWNLQMCRNYDHYESVILTIGRPVIAKNCFDQLWTYLTYDLDQIDKVTKQLEQAIDLLPDYIG